MGLKPMASHVQRAMPGYFPTPASTTIPGNLNQTHEVIGRTLASLLGINYDSMQAMANRGINLGMVVPFGPNPGLGMPAAARHVEQVMPELNQALHEAGNLGFDTVNEARTAIRSHPDWVARWDAGEGSKLHQLGEEYRRAVNNRMVLERMGMAPEQYTKPSDWEIIRERLLAQPKPAPTPPPAKVVPFKPKP